MVNSRFEINDIDRNQVAKLYRYKSKLLLKINLQFNFIATSSAQVYSDSV
jgi:hypothetical protein